MIKNISHNPVFILYNKFNSSTKPAGTHEVNFNAASVSQRIAGGVYIYTIKSNEFTASKKLMLLK